MSKNNQNPDKSMYTEQEDRLSAQSAAFLQMLTKRGILEDQSINDDMIREAARKKKCNAYHNNQLMLQHYPHGAGGNLLYAGR